MFQYVAASARFGLARALPPDEHARAAELAQQARATLAKRPLHYHRERDEIDAWIAARR
jgi:hypothetical protein